MLSLCLKQISAATIIDPTTTACDSPKRKRNTGRADTEIMEPRDTISQIKTTRRNMSRIAKQEKGDIAKYTPKAVATPFPPRNLRKRGN